MSPHTHRCPNPRCRALWRHDRDDIHTSAQFDRAHSCPKCGHADVTQKYRGSRTTKRVHTGYIDAETLRAEKRSDDARRAAMGLPLKWNEAPKDWNELPVDKMLRELQALLGEAA